MSSTPLQLQCASVVELCWDKWRSAGFLYLGRDGCHVRIGNFSLNNQVRSFCNDSSIPPHLDDSLFFSFCSTSSLNLFFPLHLFSLPCQSFSFVLLQHLLISSTFGIVMDEQKLRPPAPTLSLLCPTMISSTDVYVQPSTTAPSVPHLPTRTILYTRSHSTFNPHSNAGVHVVAESCLCEPPVPAATAPRRLFVVVSFSTNPINGVHCLFGINSFLAA